MSVIMDVLWMVSWHHCYLIKFGRNLMNLRRPYYYCRSSASAWLGAQFKSNFIINVFWWGMHLLSSCYERRAQYFQVLLINFVFRFRIFFRISRPTQWPTMTWQVKHLWIYPTSFAGIGSFLNLWIPFPLPCPSTPFLQPIWWSNPLTLFRHLRWTVKFFDFEHLCNRSPLPYNAMTSQCKALGAGPRKKLSNWCPN